MSIVPTFIHGVLDYIVSALVIGLPFVFGTTGVACYALVAIGVVGIVYSSVTDYEPALVRLIPMRTHLFLDVFFIAALVAVATSGNVSRPLSIALGAIAACAAVLVVTTKTAPPHVSQGVRQ